MNPILAQILLSVFYLVVFLVVCTTLTGSICRIIQWYYEMKLSYCVALARRIPEQEKQFV